MENISRSVIYAVNSDLDDGILYAEFETKEAALEYAKRNLDKLPFVDELEVSRDENGDINDVFSYTTIWSHAEEATPPETEDDYWDDLATMYDEEQANKHDLGDTTWFESMDNLVETLEENEDEVECKECFELFPKVDCVRVDIGYVCPTCAGHGIVSDEDIFKVEFPEYEKMNLGNDMIPAEPVAEVEPAPEVEPTTEVEPVEEVSVEEPTEEPIEELVDENDPVSEDEAPIDENSTLKTWTCWYEGDDIGTVEAATEEEAAEEMMSKYPEYQYNNTDWGVSPADELDEHVNQESPAIESDQELEGTDNAVEKCKTNPVVTHSKDELPLDSCDHEKLTEASSDDLNQIFKLCKEIGIKTGGDLNRFVKDEVDEDQSLLDALKVYQAELGDDFKTVEELNESAVLAGVATGVIVDVVKRIMDKFGDGKKKSKWIDFKKHVIEKTPEGQINIWNHDSEQVASDLKTVAAAKEKIKELIQKAKADKKAAKKAKPQPTETSTKEEEKPEETEVAGALTEANAFRQINYIDDPLDKLVMELEQNGFGRYFAPAGSEHLFKPLLLKDSADFTYGDIIDLAVEPDGTVMVITTRRTITLAFAAQIVRGKKPNMARALIQGIQAAVDAIDLAHRPTRAQRAAENAAANLDSVKAMLQANPQAAEELKAHITNIQFEVPLQDDYALILDDTDPDYEKAVTKLERLQDRFMGLPFAANAIAQGVAVNREIRESDKLWQIAQRWYLIGKINFDCPIGQLIQSKSLIKDAKVDNMSATGTVAELDNVNTVTCFNLAAALIMYFGNDVKFWE